jgi:hypothetical protein
MIEEILKYRRKLLAKLLPPLEGKDSRNDIKNLLNTCPSCGYPTLLSRCTYDICSICYWEDEGQDDTERNERWGGANGEYTLKEYSCEFLTTLENIKNEVHTDSLLNEIKNNLLLLDEIEKDLDINKNITDYIAQIKKLESLFNKYRVIIKKS